MEYVKVDANNSKMNSYLEEVAESSEGDMAKERNEKRSAYTQYTDDGYIIRPAGNVRFIKSLYPTAYQADNDMNGLFFTVHDLKTDDLLRFEDDRQETVINEIKRFWELEGRFKSLGFVHKRGILLYGSPGTGKSCIIKLVAENVVNEGDIVLVVRNPVILNMALETIRQIEPSRRILVILEDVDKMVERFESELLGLFDGDSQQDNIVFLGTTNYIDKLPPRMLRTGRFDRVIEIGNPGADGRRAYFNQKLLGKEHEEVIEYLVSITDGFNFSQLKELVVSLYCLGYGLKETFRRIKNGPEALKPSREEYLDSKLEAMTEEDVINAKVKALK